METPEKNVTGAQPTGRAYVYVIRAGKRGPLKIGVTRSVSQRVKELQIGNPEKLRICYTIRCFTFQEARDLEAELHQTFGKYRLSGEWFQASTEIWRTFLKFEGSELAKEYREIGVRVEEMVVIRDFLGRVLETRPRRSDDDF
jgi:hypothetical protein